VVANLPWVTKLSRGQRHATIAEEDLFQEGVCGLLKAIDRFEPERGLRLMTYATWYIREAMQQIRARQSHLFSISTHDQTLLGQVETLQNAFQHVHGRLPDAKEIPEAKASAQQVNRLRNAIRPMASLERGGMDGGLPVPAPDPTREFDRQEGLRVAVDKLLAVLPDREREILSRRFGLAGADAEPLENLGEDFAVSKERVRQLQRQALKRIQQHVADTGVTIDFD
jgi:RNA polymerase sigma factor (sigma-70 family)